MNLASSSPQSPGAGGESQGEGDRPTPPPTPPPAPPKVLLVDLENCPHQIQELQKNLKIYTQVIICYANHAPKIPLDWLVPLGKMVQSNRLKIFKLDHTGKNAADFGICFFAGMLMQRLPPETHFCIASNDTDLDHVVHLLTSQGRAAQRFGQSPTASPPAPSPTPTPAPQLLSVHIQAYCQRLLNQQQGRPARQETLLNSIRSYLKVTPEEATAVFNHLLARQIITLNGQKITYHDSQIKT